MVSPIALHVAGLFDEVTRALRKTPLRHPARGYLAALRDILNAIGDALDRDEDPLGAVLAKVAEEAHPRRWRR